MQRYGEGAEDIKKPTRIFPQIPSEDFKAYQTKYKENNENYDILRV
jgi:hypothetical protein